MKNTMRNKPKVTRKHKLSGGNINNQAGLDKILSIGYEVESTNLVKLTETQEFRPTYVLYNSDSARKDMEEFKKLDEYEMYDDDDNEDSEGEVEEIEGEEMEGVEEGEEEGDELEEMEEENASSKSSSKSKGSAKSKSSSKSSTKSKGSSKGSSVASSIDADISERNEEQPTAKLYSFDNGEEPGSLYPDAVFNITNDISKPKFNKTLSTLCKHLDKDYPEDNFPTDVKNELYKYKCAETGKEYDIHFKFKEDTAKKCSNFTNVEWVVTYYKPRQSNNIILDTFLNMLRNIVNHMDNLKPIPGEVIFNNPSKEGEEIVVPGRYMLYRKNKRLYYLQTDQVTSQENISNIDNVCSKIQMTFSAKAEDIIDVILHMTTDYTGFSRSIPGMSDYFKNVVEIIKHIEKCVDKLYDYFTVSNILTRDEKIKLRNKKTEVKQLKTYMFLILFKINRFYYYIFYNELVTQTYTYLKSLLTFNSRHINYALYKEIKEKLKDILDIHDDNSRIVQLVKELFLQPEILIDYLIDDTFKEDEYKELIDTSLIFSKDTIVDKDKDIYGDPSFSLNSYFDFFENPVDNEKNKKRDGSIKYYDWLEYAEHDVFSANMDLKNDIVLLECRFFQELLSSYFYHIGDRTLKQQMKNGACNKIFGQKGIPSTAGFSIANFKEIIKIPDSIFENVAKGRNTKDRNTKDRNKKNKTRKYKYGGTRKYKKNGHNKIRTKNNKK